MNSVLAAHVPRPLVSLDPALLRLSTSALTLPKLYSAAPFCNRNQVRDLKRFPSGVRSSADEPGWNLYTRRGESVQKIGLSPLPLRHNRHFTQSGDPVLERRMRTEQ